jgi:hypothetical protein
MIGEHENTSRRLRVHGVPRNRWAIVAAIAHRAAEPPAENKPAGVTAALNGSKSRPYTISVAKKLKSIVLSNVSAPPIESTPTGIFVMCRRWGRSAPASGPSIAATEATGGPVAGLVRGGSVQQGGIDARVAESVATATIAPCRTPRGNLGKDPSR